MAAATRRRLLSALREAPDLADSGHGLAIVDSLTGGSWGCRPAIGQPGKCVWARVRLLEAGAYRFLA